MCFIVTGGMLAGCTGSGQANSEGKKANALAVYSDLITSYTEKLDMDYAYQLTEKLAYEEAFAGECGFRTAGSDYEHACADYLAEEM